MSPSQLDWDSQRAEIERLYADENMGLAQVIETMRLTRGFVASISSYQRKLREWGVRKHIAWKGPNGLGAKLNARRGRATNVYDPRRGNSLTDREMRRGLRRYAAATLSDSLQHHEPDPPSPTTPKGLIVCSPVQWDQLMDFVAGDLDGIGRKESPWSRFLKSLRSLAPAKQDLQAPYSDWGSSSNSGDLTTTNIIAGGLDESQLDSPETIIIQLYRLSSKSHLSRIGTGQQWESWERFYDSMVAELIDRLGSAGLQMIKELLSRGDPITESIRDRTFGCVIRLKRLDLLRIMLDLGVELDANLQSPDWEKKTPLQFVVGIEEEDKSFEMTRLLINYGASVNKTALHRPKETPLCLAIQRNYPRLVDLLLNAGALPGPDALLLAIQGSITTDNDSIVRRLIKAGADVNWRLKVDAPICADVTLLGWAAIRKSPLLAEQLVGLNADVDALQSTECLRLLPLCSAPGHISCGAPQYTTALGLAAAVGCLETVQVLLADGHNETTPNIKGFRCPLFIACAQRRFDIVMAFLGAGLDVESADANAMGMECWPTTLLSSLSSLEPAKSEEHFEIINELKLRGACSNDDLVAQSVRSQSSQVQTQGALKRSVEEGRLEKTLQLLGAGAIPPRDISRIGSKEVAHALQVSGVLTEMITENGPDILSAALLSCQTSLATFLLENGIPVTNRETPSLHPVPLDAAIMRGEVGVVESLVRRQAPYTSRTLDLCIQSPQAEELVNWLVPYAIPTAWRRGEVSSWQTSIPSNSYAAQTLAKAAESGRRQVFQRLLESGNWASDCLGVALTSTILFGRHFLIQDLIDAGASLQGDGILHRTTGEQLSSWDAALASQQVWIVEAFVKAGVDVNRRSIQTRYTPLEVAAKACNTEVADVLLKAGADTNHPPTRDSGATPLQWAVIHNHMVLVRKLLDAGADVNAQCSVVDGRTALEGAAEHGHLDMLYLLLTNGALVDGEVGRRQYIRAVMYAENEGHMAAANLLREHGGWTEDDISLSERMELY
ncbi:hypothetical protein V8F06_013817 [Rhypophila decipiens]